MSPRRKTATDPVRNIRWKDHLNATSGPTQDIMQVLRKLSITVSLADLLNEAPSLRRKLVYFFRRRSYQVIYRYLFKRGSGERKEEATETSQGQEDDRPRGKIHFKLPPTGWKRVKLGGPKVAL
ncbi:hypothetical protein TWF730_002106 [Orbilia blumenaviensis]|uniref:Uncharacterized protein n=1 Tax=Orbilia blumenaviensis TaxID=1796055 RepID=A0AAV9UDK7_9PEZI